MGDYHYRYYKDTFVIHCFSLLQTINHSFQFFSEKKYQSIMLSYTCLIMGNGCIAYFYFQDHMVFIYDLNKLKTIMEKCL